MFSLVGKVALVTGATGGIGQAIAEKLKSLGAVVALSGTRLEVLNELADRLGEGAHVFPTDLSDRAAVDEVVKTVESELGKIDILVNNAGVTKDALCLRMDDDDWDRVIEIDLTASFRLVRACLKGMMRRRFGRIIGITSVVAVAGSPGQSNYAAAKAGMIGMSKALAAEVATRNITVNCVAPGFIETKMTAQLGDARRQAILSNIPVGRMGNPSDVASAVVYLASDEGSYVTGQTLHVNGGLAMI